ncbi:Transmembrane protein 60 [Halocaridina rubra]|uniref:Transmembrane protein 60 n=1 Tax=Halocaridina rubra TaxID=373956 RepID=A0AAN8XJ63_HALRR
MVSDQNRQYDKETKHVHIVTLCFWELSIIKTDWGIEIRMAMLHRALFTWFLLLVFLILLALRLDHRTKWNWFIVFIPMWFYDAILLIYISIHMINECRTAVRGSGGSHHRTARQRVSAILQRVWPLCAVILKMAFMVILCLKLESSDTTYFPSYHVLMPLWILLMGLCINVLHCLVLQHQDRYP